MTFVKLTLRLKKTSTPTLFPQNFEFEIEINIIDTQDVLDAEYQMVMVRLNNPTKKSKIKTKMSKNFKLVSMFFKWADPSDTHKGFACLPYISGLTEPLTRLLRKNEIRVVNKPFKTLPQEFPSPKFRQPPDLQSNVVYKIPCKDCPWNYIGETGRCFQT